MQDQKSERAVGLILGDSFSRKDQLFLSLHSLSVEPDVQRKYQEQMDAKSDDGLFFLVVWMLIVKNAIVPDTVLKLFLPFCIAGC